MNKRFAFFYFMKVGPDRLMEVVPAHREYWKVVDPPNYMGGPFGDRSGGMIMFDAASIEEAEKIAGQDPFVLEDILGDRWVKEWLVK
jgi:uncharacterized protein YciI